MAGRPPRPPRAGFTLLEILMAMGLVATALVAVAGAIEAAGRRILAARELVRAARVARAAMAEAVARTDPDKAAGSGESGAFRWRVEVEEEAFVLEELTLDPTTRKITVTVTWRGGRRSLVLTTRRSPAARGRR